MKWILIGMAIAIVIVPVIRVLIGIMQLPIPTDHVTLGERTSVLMEDLPSVRFMPYAKLLSVT